MHSSCECTVMLALPELMVHCQQRQSVGEELSASLIAGHAEGHTVNKGWINMAEDITCTKGPPASPEDLPPTSMATPTALD